MSSYAIASETGLMPVDGLSTGKHRKAPSRSAFTTAEKNLASLGYFSPSNKRVRCQRVKTIEYTRIIDGNKVQVRTTIVPGSIYGLPTTADQDKYLALQKLVTDIRNREGEVRNPIGFSSAELLALLGRNKNSGRNYEHIDAWLNVMTATTIISEGTVFLSGRKTWAMDRFRVFDRAVSFGSELDGGTRADRNYVWFSEWQLENINNNHLLPIDFEGYRRLKNPIAKALVLHLQIWLYASREAGHFEKRYDELCQILNLHPYSHRSKIEEKLGPSLDELATHGYLKGWRVDRTRDRVCHKIIFRHGERFGGDQCKVTAASGKHWIGSERDKETSQMSNAPREPDPPLLSELIKRGIPEGQARKLLLDISDSREVMDQLEWGDFLIRKGTGTKIINPTGFYIYLIKENIQPPAEFETSRKRILHLAAKQAHDRQSQEQAAWELAYDKYGNQEIDKYVAGLPEARYRELLEQKEREIRHEYKAFAHRAPEAVAKVVESGIRSDLSRSLPILSFEQFCESESQRRVQHEIPCIGT